MPDGIEAGGRVRRVSVARAGGGFAVTVDGRVHRVDAVRVDAQTLSLIVEGDADSGSRRVYDAVLAPERTTGRLIVRIGGVPVSVSAGGAPRRTATDAVPGAGPLRIVAPMPGKIVRVLVESGDQVLARQPVVVIEAMKMENELRAGRDGTVVEILAREGASVDSGAVLVVIR